MKAGMVAGATGIAMGLASGAQAGSVLGSFTNDFGGTFAGEINEATLELVFETDIFTSPAVTVVGGPSLVDAGDVGMTWMVDGAALAPILAQLGDGDSFDAIGFSLTAATFAGPQTAGQTAVEFGWGAFGLDPHYLAAHTAQIVATLTDLSFAESPLSDHSIPNGEGIITDYTVGVRFEFIGVPAPGTVSLLCIGGMMARRRRRE